MLNSARWQAQIKTGLGYLDAAWRWLVTPAPHLSARDAQRQARLVAALFVVFMPVGFIATAMPHLIAGNWRKIFQDVDVLTMCALLVFAGVTFWLSRTRYYTLATVLIIVGATLAVFAASMPEDNYGDYIGLYYVVVPIVLTSILFSGRAAFALAALDLFAIYLMPQIIPQYPAQVILLGPFRFVFTMAVIMLLTVAYRDALERTRRAELAASEIRYRLVVEQATEGIVLYDMQTKRVVESNPAYQAMLGYTAAELRGLTLYDIVAHDRASIDALVARIAREKHVPIGARQHRRKDRTLVDVEVSVSLFTADEREVMCVVVRDITERQRAEHAAHVHTQQLEALREINLGLSAELDVDALLNLVARHVLELSQADGSGFYWYDPARDVVERLITLGNSLLSAGTVWRRGEGLAGKVLATGQPVIVDDYATWEGRSDKLPADAHFALMGVPVVWGDDILGVLVANRFSARPFTPTDLQMLTMLASHAAIAIRNARAVQAEQQQRRRAEALARATAVLTETLEPDALLEKILRAALQTIAHADKGSILLVDKQTNELTMRCLVGYSDPRIHTLRFAFDQGYAHRAFATGAPLAIANARAAEWRYDGDLAELRAIQSAIAAPLFHHEQPIGVISLDNATHAHAFDADDLELLTAFAHQASAAIENAQLHRQIALSEERYRVVSETISDFAFSLAFAPSGDLTLEWITDAFTRATGYVAHEISPATWTSIVHPHDVPSSLLAFQSLQQGNAVECQLRLVAKNGAARCMRISARPIWNADRTHIVRALGAAQDITARMLAEYQREAFANLGHQLNTATTPAQAAQIIVDAADCLLGWDACLLILYAREKDECVTVLEADLIDGARTFITPTAVNNPTTPLLRRVLNGEVILLNQDVARGESALERFGDTARISAALMFVPIRHGDQAIGVVSIQSYTPHAYTQQSLDTLQALADHCGGALERIRGAEHIRTSLAEKEVLLKEIHHRVKNNLQIVSSLLNLQELQIKDARVADVLRDSQNRVRSMALIHERLYRAPDLARVDFAEYIRGLATHLWQSYSAHAKHIALDLAVAPLSLAVDTAIPCGLILNELISNALKHAFPGERGGAVKIQLAVDEQQRVVLCVADDGVGLPRDLDVTQTGSLGLSLVNTLVSQIGGTLAFELGQGTIWRITFAAAR